MILHVQRLADDFHQFEELQFNLGVLEKAQLIQLRTELQRLLYLVDSIITNRT